MTPDYSSTSQHNSRHHFNTFFRSILTFLIITLLLLGVKTLQAQQGAVYAMTNGEGQIAGNVQGPNAVVAYAQAADGTLSLIGSYPTGGNGGDFDGGEGLDPLISAYAITKTLDNRFVLAVNAGSNSVTAMKVNPDFSLTVTDTEGTQDIGPNSIAFKPSSMPGVSGLVYVSNITRSEFLDQGEPGHQGSVIGYRLMDNGDLIPVANSLTNLRNRPSAVQFSPDGNYLVIASINAGASALESGSQDELVVYKVNPNGTLSAGPTGAATSTKRDNTEGRNLPSAIGFQIVGDNYVVVTEAREFQPNGAPPAFPALQDGSVSTWQIMPNGTLRPIDLDIASGVNNTGRTACWLDFSDENTFFVSNAIEAGLASYSFNNGNIELLDQVAAQGTGATGNTTDPAAAFSTTEGWIDLWISDDGKYLYQCYGLTGEVGVFAINGAELTLIQEIDGLPQNNVQGIVAVGQPTAQEEFAQYRVIFDATWSEVTHPTDFPGEEPNIARWSPVAGMTHNSAVQLFTEGTIANQGIVNISQTGSRQPLDAEIAGYINAGHAETYIESATRVRPSPDTISTTFEVSTSHPYLSLASMIAPSPDWFVGFNNLNLVENGKFVESKVVQFVPYDSGSDSGESFASPNEDTQPREPIFKITDGVLEGENGYIPSLGIWRIERIDANRNCNAHGGYLAGGPFTFAVDGTPDNIPAGALTLTGTNGAFNQWVVTDDRGNILGLPSSFTAPNFDAAGVGVCFIRNLTYDDGLEGLAVGNNIEDLSGCFSFSNGIYVNRVQGNAPTGPAVGAVYAMTNGEGQVPGIVQGPNAVVAYAQAADGTLSVIGTYPTGGNGGDFDGGEGLDPLISAYAITKTEDNRFVLAVNAGSNTVTSMRVNADFSLTVIDTEPTGDIGPNSIAHKPSAMAGINGLVYVSNITRPEFLDQGEPGHQGSVIGYRLMDDGSLEPVANSTRDLRNRPSAVQFSPDGNFLVVASINAGASALQSGSEDEIVVYEVNNDGTLSAGPSGAATSTLRGNAEGRNLPSAIGFQIVDDNYVVVTEAREFQPNGAPPAFPALQDGSVSTWQIMPNGTLIPIDLDVASGINNTGRTACWLDFSDENTFFVSNAIEAGLASYSFNNGNIELLNQVAAQGTGATGNTTDPAAAFSTTEGWIDLWISDDGKYLYQCYGLTGEVGVFAINGAELTLIQEIGGLPQNNVQGIVAVGQPRTVAPPVAETTAKYRITFDAAWSAVTHPTDFPADPRWSPVAGMTHDASTQLFEEGTIATQGIVNISQTGSRQPLDAEIAALIAAGQVETYIESITRVRPSPDTITTTFEVSSSHPYLSLASMIAPSPDWFVGFNNLNLIEDGQFIESRIVQFVPYDSGSDSGESFESPNQDTQPRETIYEITDGVLAHDGQINSLGIWRIERIDAGSSCNVSGGSIVGGPFEYCVDGEADNIPTDGISLTGNTGANSQWVITDERGYILGLPPTFTAPNFDAAGVGVCFVWHLSYEDGLQGLAMGNNIESLDGCFNLSNSIYVKRKECLSVCDGIGGGTLAGGPFEFCVGDGRADNLTPGSIALAGAQGSNSQWVVTDDQGNILGLPPMPSAVDFDGAGPGVCLVWHLSYEDGLQGLAAGNNVSQLDGCYDLSNSVSVIRHTDGAICEAAVTCETPTNIVVNTKAPRKVRIDWDKVEDASRYRLEIRFAGKTKIVGRGLVRGNGVFVIAPAGRDYEVRVKTICQDGSESEFSDWVPYSTPSSDGFNSTENKTLYNSSNATQAEGRSNDNNLTTITIPEEVSNALATYPNPVSDLLTVNYTTTTETAVLTIFHVSGQQVLEQALGQDQVNHQVEVGNLSNGIYLVRIDESGKTPVTQRIVKGSNR